MAQNGEMNARFVDAALRMEATRRIHPKKWARHGKKFIESINLGQGPRVLAVGPRVVGGLKSKYLNKPGYGGIPGNVFEVTTHNNGTLDEVGLGSAYYAIRHLGIQVVDVWSNGKKTEGVTISSLLSLANLPPLEMRKISIAGDESTNVEEADSVIIACSDSRVQAHDVYDDAIVVYNAGNVLSPVALEVIEEAIGNNVPIAMVMGHTRCGAVSAALAGNSEFPLGEIMYLIGQNLQGESEIPEMKNAIACAENLRGLLAESGMEVMGTFLDLADGQVMELEAMGEFLKLVDQA